MEFEDWAVLLAQFLHRIAASAKNADDFVRSFSLVLEFSDFTSGGIAFNLNACTDYVAFFEDGLVAASVGALAVCCASLL